MSEQGKTKKGCLGCAGIGCATYIVLCVVALLCYVFLFDSPMDAVKKCSFKTIVLLKYVGAYGQTMDGFRAFLDNAQKSGVDIDKGLGKAISGNKAVSDVDYREERAAGGTELVVAAMQVKGAAHGDGKVYVAVVFMVKPKSLFDFERTSLMRVMGVTATYKGYSEELGMDVPMPGCKTPPCLGLDFLAALYSGDAARMAEFADSFMTSTEAKLADAGQ